MGFTLQNLAKARIGDQYKKTWWGVEGCFIFAFWQIWKQSDETRLTGPFQLLIFSNQSNRNKLVWVVSRWLGAWCKGRVALVESTKNPCASHSNRLHQDALDSAATPHAASLRCWFTYNIHPRPCQCGEHMKSSPLKKHTEVPCDTGTTGGSIRQFRDRWQPLPFSKLYTIWWVVCPSRSALDRSPWARYAARPRWSTEEKNHWISGQQGEFSWLFSDLFDMCLFAVVTMTRRIYWKTSCKIPTGKQWTQ